MRPFLGCLFAIHVFCLAQNVLIRKATVVDGSGGPSRVADVRITGSLIARVGPSLEPGAGENVVDATGLTLAPGFIDLHNHSDRGLDAEPTALTQVSQGITTAALGMDGSSPLPLSTWIERRRSNPAAIHTLLFVGHASVRTKVMGTDYRRPRPRRKSRR